MRDNLLLTQRAMSTELGNSCFVSMTSLRVSLILDYGLFYTFQRRMQGDGVFLLPQPPVILTTLICFPFFPHLFLF